MLSIKIHKVTDSIIFLIAIIKVAKHLVVLLGIMIWKLKKWKIGQ